MTFPDRTQAPAVQPIDYRPLPPVQAAQLSNGIRVFMVQGGDLPVVKIALAFRAGNVYAQKPGLAGITAKMLKEGTESQSANAFADWLDSEGIFLNTSSGQELLNISTQSLSEKAGVALHAIAEVLYTPTFPADAFELLRSRTAQGMAVQAERTSYHAQRLFLTELFGNEHPYGAQFGPEELAALQLSDVRSFHRQFMQPENMFLVISGQFDEKTLLKLLEKHFGYANNSNGVPAAEPAGLPEHTAATGRIRHTMPEKEQASLRLGHRGFRRQHPDYYKVRLATTLLGGYFGSRLMKNIREEKGYTYGIFASWVALRHGGYFLVGTDVGKDYIADTLNEVKREIVRLQQEPVTAEELQTAKNYLLGRLLSRRETPFQVGDIVRSFVANDLPFEEEEIGFRATKEVTVETVQHMAQQYFRPEALLEVIAGPAFEPTKP